MRLGIWLDLVYRRDEDGVISTDRAVVLFVASLAGLVDEVVLFGRLDPEPGRAEYALPAGVRFVPFPHYPSVKDVAALARALRATMTAFVRELPNLDAVWIFGPYPVSFALVARAWRRRKPVFLGVRQDFPEYVRSRLPSARWRWAVLAAHLMEQAWRVLSLRYPTVVVGQRLGRRYGRRALATTFSLIQAADVNDDEDALARRWDGDLVALSVGRLDPEKNPLLLAEILALLPANWHVQVIGRGPLESDLRRRALELGVNERLELVGYVPAGPELWRRYRDANAFLHVSWTEGLPQVLSEALAAGTPIVATDVGGVAAALQRGELGLLVEPGDAGAAAGALERLAGDPGLREALVRRGLAAARLQTREAQLAEIVAYFRSAIA